MTTIQLKKLSINERWDLINSKQDTLYEQTKAFHKNRDQLSIAKLQEVFARYNITGKKQGV